MRRLAHCCVLAVTLLVGLPAQPQELPAEVQATPPIVGSDPRAAGRLMVVPEDTPREDELLASTGAQFSHRGFLRAPLLLGFSPREGGGTDISAPGRVPDFEPSPDAPGRSLYLGNWKNTGNVQPAFTQFSVTYSDEVVGGTIGFSAHDFTGIRQEDARQAQVGVYAAFVSLRQPNVLGTGFDFDLAAGLVPKAYGTSGKYDTGRYDTFLFGALSPIGEVLGIERKLPHLVLRLEHGLGARPYPKGSSFSPTFVHHAHLGARYADFLGLAAHYASAWTDDASQQTNGRLTVTGAEVRLNGLDSGPSSALGDLYVGFSHLQADNSSRVGPALFVIDGFGGAGVARNYFLGPNTSLESAPNSGSVNTLLVQYDTSIGSLLNYPRGRTERDLQVGVFAMTNWVSVSGATHRKLKYGASAMALPLRWLGAGLRFDRVEPYSYAPARAFSVLTPKLLFHSRFFGAHEEILLQYSRYFHGAESLPYQDPVIAEPAEPYARDTVYLSASIWW